MAFKLKSGNKPKFKEVGSSPLKIDTSLADANIDYTADVPAAGVLLTSEDHDDTYDTEITPKVTPKDAVDEEKVTEAVQKIRGTGEEYKGRKQRRAEKQLRKEEDKLESGKKWLTPEQRRAGKITKLTEKQTEARSKGATSYNLKWSLGEGVQESLEPKADRLQRRIDKLKRKQPVTGTTSAGTEYKVLSTKEHTKSLKSERKAKEKTDKAAEKAQKKEGREAKRTKRKEGREAKRTKKQAKRNKNKENNKTK